MITGYWVIQIAFCDCLVFSIGHSTKISAMGKTVVVGILQGLEQKSE